MEVYINMNNSKINNPNDMYKLFKKNFIKVLDIKEYFMAVIIVIKNRKCAAWPVK